MPRAAFRIARRAQGRRVARLALLLALSVGVACGGKKDELIVKTGGAALDDEKIEKDPLALLPSGAIGISYLDAQQMFASPFGQQLLTVLRARLPVPASAGFDPARDLTHVYAGLYSMTGVDVAAVVVGSFDRAKIEAAADGTQQTPLGAPLVKTSYAGRTLFTSLNIGFSVLTSHLLLVGNEVGIRRALDRVQEGRVSRNLPKWMEQLLATPEAPMISGFDFKEHPVTGALTGKLPFLGGASSVRMVGNFKAPGINFAGSVTYPDDAAATQGSAQLRNSYDALHSITAWAQLFHLDINNPITQFDTQAVGPEAQFVAGIDGAGATSLINLLAMALNLSGPPTTVEATTSAPVGQP